SADVDECVGGAEVDRHVTADDAVRHAGCLAASRCSGEGRGHTPAPPWTDAPPSAPARRPVSRLGAGTVLPALPRRMTCGFVPAPGGARPAAPRGRSTAV